MTKIFAINTVGRKQNGFSLIEILIALAIVGILSSFAVPSYNNYVLRAKVTEAAELNAMVRLAMIQYHKKHGKFVDNYGSLGKRNKVIGLEDSSKYESGVITKMWVGSKGVRGKDSTSSHIAIILDSSLELSSGNSMLLSTIEYVNGSYQFICGNTNAVWRSNIDHKFLPKSCQN